MSDLSKLSRKELNELASSKGIEDASNEEKFVTKADLISAIETSEPTDKPASEPQETPATLDTPPIDSPEDVDDKSGVEPAPTQAEDEPEEEEEEPAPVPTQRGSAQDTDGMGFPRKKGKTVSVISGKPHEAVRNVAGVMVPLTMEEAVGDSNKGIVPVSDAEVIEKLKKLGKL